MNATDPKAALLSIVEEHGFEKVEEYLQEIAVSERVSAQPLASSAPSPVPTKRTRNRTRRKPSASQYVTRLDVSPDKAHLVNELATRFDGKSFMPAFNDAAEFCHIYGIEPPASRSRANVIPRVFKRIAALETDQIQRIVDGGHFSGPSRLGPISDAIRRNGRAARS